jgi:hypothetical protein
MFKKPWTLSEKLEFMAGFGREWIHRSAYGVIASSPGVETILDFMFWPPRSIDLAGILKRATTTTSREGITARLA